jgi:tRNA modification GTPase
LDTIVAIATAPGRGAIGVVRVSGPAARGISEHVCARSLKARNATHLSFLDAAGEPIDDGLAIFFPAPHSYTGEDVLELQGHGGPGVQRLVVERCLEVGLKLGGQVRLAQPGEFTQRAFLNDKLDLAQAEAVADLINAGSERAARSALASLQGRFSQLIHGLQEQLVDLRLRVEACLDFPEEDIEFIGRERVKERLEQIQVSLGQIQDGAKRGLALREGLRVVLVGPPNVGKSSLLNALAEQDIALVTDTAGTTRDRIIEEITIEGMPIHIIDTAGIRHTTERVEQMGIERTWKEVEQAQAVMLLQDASGQIPHDSESEVRVLAILGPSARGAVVRVLNKADLAQPLPTSKEVEGILVSAKTGQGLDDLRQTLLRLAGDAGDASAGVFSARGRQLDALARAAVCVAQAQDHLREEALDLLADSLQRCQNALSEITGEFSSDDLLGEIFSNFCIGK